jgi:hypothetical protein
MNHISMSQCEETWDDQEVGKQTFIHHNRKTRKENVLNMGKKVKVTDARNGIPEYSLGDKIYKQPEHSSGFYRDGGLIVGSSN